MELNEKIKYRRDQLGLTLQEVGDFLGVSKATVLKYETGEIKNLKLGTVEKLSEILLVTPGYLMGWEEYTPQATTLREVIIEREERKQLTFVHELLSTMVNQGIIKDVNDIDESMKKMILEAVKIEVLDILKDKN